MDIYQILIYAIPVLIIAGAVFFYGRKILRWSDNNHAEITEHEAIVVTKETKERIFRNYSTGGGGIPAMDRQEHILFRMKNGKKMKLIVDSATFIKTDEGDEGILRLKGTRFISFEKIKENNTDE